MTKIPSYSGLSQAEPSEVVEFAVQATRLWEERQKAMASGYRPAPPQWISRAKSASSEANGPLDPLHSTDPKLAWSVKSIEITRRVCDIASYLGGLRSDILNAGKRKFDPRIATKLVKAQQKLLKIFLRVAKCASVSSPEKLIAFGKGVDKSIESIASLVKKCDKRSSMRGSKPILLQLAAEQKKFADFMANSKMPAQAKFCQDLSVSAEASLTHAGNIKSGSWRHYLFLSADCFAVGPAQESLLGFLDVLYKWIEENTFSDRGALACEIASNLTCYFGEALKQLQHGDLDALPEGVAKGLAQHLTCYFGEALEQLQQGNFKGFPGWMSSWLVEHLLKYFGAALGQLQRGNLSIFPHENAFLLTQSLTSYLDGVLEKFRNLELDTIPKELACLLDNHHVAHFSGVLEKFRNGDASSISPDMLQILADHHTTIGGWDGPIAHSNLWFNEPYQIAFAPDCTPRLTRVTERVVERFWVMNQILPPGPDVRVLDIGCAESLLSLELASSGYSVTAVDFRSYPFKHPNLTSFQGDALELSLGEQAFDVLILLSVIEHVGIGFYGGKEEKSLDTVFIEKLSQRLKPSGQLLMTVPFGQKAEFAVHRIYDLAGLEALLEGFDVEVLEFAIRRDEVTWLRPVTREEAIHAQALPDGTPGAVALVKATKRPS